MAQRTTSVLAAADRPAAVVHRTDRTGRVVDRADLAPAAGVARPRLRFAQDVIAFTEVDRAGPCLPHRPAVVAVIGESGDAGVLVAGARVVRVAAIGDVADRMRA